MVIKEEVLAKIEDLLKELSQKYEVIADHDDINLLEYELFEADAIYFSEYVKVLRKLQVEHSLNENKEDTTEYIANDENSDSEHGETIASENEAVNTTDPQEDSYGLKSSEVKEDAVSEKGESSYNSEEREGGTYESTLILEEDEIVAEEDEVILENQELTAPVDTQPLIIEERKSTAQEVVIEEKEFTFKVETETIEREEDSDMEPMSLSQSYSASKPQSLNDRISALRQSQATESGSNLGGLQRTVDIKSSINLNDKLLFIKDLFNGYSLAYSEAIELLNRYESFEEADLFLKNNYSDKNNWHTKKDTVEKLYAILRKRYG